MWDVLLALLAVCGLCVFLTKQTKIPAGFTPLVALCSTALWFSIVGALGFLWMGGILWYVLCFASLIFTLVKYGVKNSLSSMQMPAFLFFVLAGVMVCIYLGVRQPLLHEWDEYSLWGTTVKIMKAHNELYTTAPNGFAWASTQTPTLPVLSYFVQLFGKYAAWKIYAAYSLLYLAVISALIGTVAMRKYQVAVPLGIIGLMTPWVMTLFYREYKPKLVWLLAYGDIPAGMLFAGVLLLYFGLRVQKAPLWPVLPALAALALIKDNTFVFSLAAAGIMLLDLLLISSKKTESKVDLIENQKAGFLAKKRALFGTAENYTLLGRIGYGISYLIAAVLPYMLWTRYIAGIVSQRQSSGISDPSSESPFSALVLGTKMLFGLEEKTERFSEIGKLMWNEFFVNSKTGAIGGSPISMFGGGLITVCVITIIFVVAAILLKDKKMRLRTVISYFSMLLCYIGYSYEIFISYVFIINEGDSLIPSYNRYMYGYYIGWFLLAVYFLGQAALSRMPEKEKGTSNLRGILAQGVVLLLAGGMILRSTMLLPLGNSDIGYAPATFNKQRVAQNFADTVIATIAKDSDGPQRIFFVSQGDSAGEKWFMYHYMMIPDIVDYSGVAVKVGGAGGGGGTYTSPDMLNGENPASYNTYSPEEIQAYITESGITYMLIETVDDRFIDSYSELFTDKLKQAETGETVLYKVEGAGSSLQLSPVEMEVPVR